MLLHSQKEPFQRDGWIYEPKLDGMRCIAIVEPGCVQLFSRNGRDITATFPAVAKGLAQQKRDLVLDGEIVAFSQCGHVDFVNLQSRWLIKNANRAAEQDRFNPTAYYAFDILQFDGKSTAHLPLLERKALLADSLEESELIKRVQHFEDGLILYQTCRDHKFEGIVAKRANSLYKPGVRSKDWIKIKFTLQDHLVIVGHVEGAGFPLGQQGKDRLKLVGAVQYGFSTAAYEDLEKRLQQVEAPIKEPQANDLVSADCQRAS